MKKIGFHHLLEIGDKHEFCYTAENGISRVDYGELLEINKENKTFTFYSNWQKKPIENITAVRHVGYISEQQWKENT